MNRYAAQIRVGLLVAGALCFILAIHRRMVDAEPTQHPLREAIGRRLPQFYVRRSGHSGGDTIYVTDESRVIYIFSTRCQYCTMQRQHIAALVGDLAADQVLTISGDPSSATRDYWAGTRLARDTPLTVTPGLLNSLGVREVPALLFADSTGVIVSAFAGTVLDWDRDRLLLELSQTR